MTTEVSSNPRGCSATRGGVLIEALVDVDSELVSVDRRGVGERCQSGISGDEPAATHWSQLADGYAVAGDAEGLAGIERAHDLAAVVAQFSLR